MVLGVNRQTAENWVQMWRVGDVSLGRSKVRKRILNDAIVNDMVSGVEEDPTLTLSMLRLRLKAEVDKEVSLTAVANYLACSLMTLARP